MKTEEETRRHLIQLQFEANHIEHNYDQGTDIGYACMIDVLKWVLEESD